MYSAPASSAQSFRYQAHGLVEQLLEGNSLKSRDAEFGKYLLLANTQIKAALTDLGNGRTIGRCLDNGLLWPVGRVMRW
jgi:hypothetical protein